MSSPKKQPSVLNRVSWVAETQEEPDPLDLVSRAEAGALSLLDLSANRRFAVLDTERRSGLIERIASAAAASSSKLRTVLLNELNLDNSNAPAVATLLVGVGRCGVPRGRSARTSPRAEARSVGARSRSRGERCVRLEWRSSPPRCLAERQCCERGGLAALPRH